MKRGINILVGAVVLVLVLCFAVKSLFNINNLIIPKNA